MPFPQRVLRLISKVHKPERDPARAERTYAEFDEGRHYDAYHAHCRAACRREFAAEVDTTLDRDGFQYLRALSADRARTVSTELQQNHPLQLLKKDSQHLEGFHTTDRAWLQSLFAEILTGETDQAIAAYFGSEYLLHWYAFSLTRPAERQESVSFRWHCDKGPSRHLKLIVYLNPTAEHGGNTEFIDLRDTAAVAGQGYVFGWSKSRSDEVGHLSRLAGRPLTTHLQEREAGEAVLFQPSRVLHRGISPTRGDRLTATLCILPSPVPWFQAWQSNTMHDLTVDQKWHADAMQLLDRLGAVEPLIED